MVERLDTIIDRLVEYVQSSGKVTLTDASHVVGLNKNEVEELADLLAKSGLIELQYGLSEIILVAKKPGSDKTETNLILKKKGGAKEKEDSEIVTQAKSLAKDVSKEKSSISFIESDAKQRLEKVQQFVQRLEGKKELTNEEADYLYGESDLFLKEMKQFETSLDNLRMKAVDFQEQILLMKSRIKSLPKIGPKKYVVKESVASEIKNALGSGINPQLFLPKLPPLRLPALPSFPSKQKAGQTTQNQAIAGSPQSVQPKETIQPIIVSKATAKPASKKESLKKTVKKQVKQAPVKQKKKIQPVLAKAVKPVVKLVKPVSLLKTKNKKKQLR